MAPRDTLPLVDLKGCAIFIRNKSYIILIKLWMLGNLALLKVNILFECTWFCVIMKYEHLCKGVLYSCQDMWRSHTSYVKLASHASHRPMVSLACPHMVLAQASINEALFVFRYMIIVNIFVWQRRLLQYMKLVLKVLFL